MAVIDIGKFGLIDCGLTCEVHDGAAELELAGVVHLEPVGDQGVAEAPGHPSAVTGHLKMSPEFMVLAEFPRLTG